MFRNVAKNETIETGTVVTGLDESSIQPNAVDLRVAKIERLTDEVVPMLLENGKQHASAEEVRPEFMDFDGKKIAVYNLTRGYYRVTLQNKIEVAENQCGWVIPRSSLTRNGAMLYSALYDSGYNGSMVAGLNVIVPRFVLEYNTRIGQYLCVDAESLHKYNGSYQGK